LFVEEKCFAKLNAFDLSFLASNFRLTLLLITALAIAGLIVFALLSRRVVAFWERLRQGFAILRDRRRYLRQVVAFQAVAWLCRAAAFWCFLDAFRIGGSVGNVMLVFGVNAVSGMIPLTPGGAGVQQALFIQVFAHGRHSDIVAAYSVGQQIVIAALTAGVGFLALIVIFRFRSFKEVIHAGRADRAAEAQARQDNRDEPAAPTAVRRVPRERV